MKHHTRLEGKGVEILFGQAQDKRGLRLPPAKPPSLMGARPAASPRLEADVEEALAAEWASWQSSESLQGTLGSGSGVGTGAVPDGDGSAVAPASAIPSAPPARPAGLAQDSTKQTGPAERGNRTRTVTLAPLSESSQVHGTATAVSVDSPQVRVANLADQPGETMPSPMYVEAHIDSQGFMGQALPSSSAPEGQRRSAEAEPTAASGQIPTTAAVDGQLEPEGPETPELQLDDVESHEEEQPSPVRAEEEVIDYVAPEQRQALWNETVELYEIVPNLLSTDENLASALRLLQEAQDILLEKPRQFDVASYKVGQVSGIVNRRLNTSRWANTYGWAAFAYEALWIGILVLAIFLSPVAVQSIVSISEGIPSMDPVALSVLWNTMAWGGLGGVIGAFYSLYWHAAKQKDFDKQYMMWYIVQPVIGLLVGGLVHLLFGAGFLTVMSNATTTSEVVLSALPYAVACIAGFRQRFILEIIDRVIQLLTPQPKVQQPSTGGKSDTAASSALQ